MTRRKFLKRTGGATVAAMLAAQLAVVAQEVNNGGGNSSFAMLCIDPDAIETPVEDTFSFGIDMGNGTTAFCHVDMNVSSTKITDPPGTIPYLAERYSGEGLVGLRYDENRVWSRFVNEYSVTCDSTTGFISAVFASIADPIEKKISVAGIEVTFIAIRGPVTSYLQPLGGHSALALRTGLKLKFSWVPIGQNEAETYYYPGSLESDDYVYVWTVFDSFPV
jgi:hypothetical protein